VPHAPPPPALPPALPPSPVTKLIIFATLDMVTPCVTTSIITKIAEDCRFLMVAHVVARASTCQKCLTLCASCVPCRPIPGARCLFPGIGNSRMDGTVASLALPRRCVLLGCLVRTGARPSPTHVSPRRALPVTNTCSRGMPPASGLPLERANNVAFLLSPCARGGGHGLFVNPLACGVRILVLIVPLPLSSALTIWLQRGCAGAWGACRGPELNGELLLWGMPPDVCPAAHPSRVHMMIENKCIVQL
jgi:hypothetical protein